GLRVACFNVRIIPLISSGSIVGAIYLENGLTPHAFSSSLVRTLKVLASPMGISINNARLYRHLSELNEAHARFLPKEFLDTLNYDSILDVRLGDQVARRMTVVFSDIRDYTTLSEGMSPKDNFDFINGYLRRISPNIEQNQGFISQYYGDGMMAIFPDSEKAVAACVGMQRSLMAYNEERVAKERIALRMGIGIHTGNLMLGVIGDHDRHDVTVISDVVNGASRIEGLTKIFGVGMVVSEDTMEGIADRSDFRHRFLGEMKVIGKNKAIPVYEIFEAEDPKIAALKDETLKIYKEALELYFAKNFAGAAGLFRKILDVNPKDQVAKHYITKSAEYLVSGVPEDWTGVEIMQQK
ncbi:MAG: hypothetical protein KTR24_13775, partial [Saprospiraceae bacterium]|nr:hypothetical protein [Saprospiraceae bacterium]